MLTEQQTPEQAAAALEKRWNQITDEQGVDIQVEALQTLNAVVPDHGRPARRAAAGHGRPDGRHSSVVGSRRS